MRILDVSRSPQSREVFPARIVARTRPLGDNRRNAAGTARDIGIVNMTIKKSRAEDQDALKNLAEEVATKIDESLGRTAPDGPFAKMEAIEIDEIVPASVRQKPWYVTITETLKLSGIALAFIALLGQGTVSALVASIVNSATIGTALSFGQAFFVTFALSVSASVFAYMAFRGHMKSYGALLLWVFATLVIVNISENLGFGGPTSDQFSREIGRTGNPLGKAFLAMRVFVGAYGILPFLSGLVVGWGCGRMASEIERQRTA